MTTQKNPIKESLMNKDLKQINGGANVGSSDKECDCAERAERERWVKRLKEERLACLRNELLEFLAYYSENTFYGTTLHQKHKSAVIGITFRKPEIVIQLNEHDFETGKYLRSNMFVAEAISDPKQIDNYWDMLGEWLGDTVRFGELFADEENAE